MNDEEEIRSLLAAFDTSLRNADRSVPIAVRIADYVVDEPFPTGRASTDMEDGELSISGDTAVLFRASHLVDYKMGLLCHFVRTPKGWRIAGTQEVDEDPSDHVPLREAPPDEAFVDRLPDLVESPYNFVSAFQPNTEVWSQVFDDAGNLRYQSGPIEVLQLGELAIPSGSLLIAESNGLTFGEGFMLPLRISPGQYPVQLARASHRQDAGILRMTFGKKPAVRHAYLESDRNWAATETIFILDAERGMTATRAEAHKLCYEDVSVKATANVPFRGVNVIACSGYTFGGEMHLFWGISEEGDPVEIVVSFGGMFRKPERATFSVNMPPAQSAIPLGTIPWVLPLEDGSVERRELPIQLSFYDYKKREAEAAPEFEPDPYQQRFVPPWPISWEVTFEEYPEDVEILNCEVRWFEPEREEPTTVSYDVLYASAFPEDCFERGGTIQLSLEWAQHRFFRAPL